MTKKYDSHEQDSQNIIIFSKKHSENLKDSETETKNIKNNYLTLDSKIKMILKSKKVKINKKIECDIGLSDNIKCNNNNNNDTNECLNENRKIRHGEKNCITDKNKCSMVTKYYFKLENPQIITLYNNSCDLDACIILPNCLKVGTSIFKIRKLAFIKYQNLDVHSDSIISYAQFSKGYATIPIETSNDVKYNKICIEKFFIEVTPLCDDSDSTQKESSGILSYKIKDNCY